MYIQTDDNGNIIQLITIGDKPEINGYEISNDISEDILKNIFSYKYIDGEFVYKKETDTIKLNKIRGLKLESLSRICNTLIEKGIDYNGSHYSLTKDDQINIMSISSDIQLAILTKSEHDTIMYHADNEECREYTVEEILGLAALAKKYIKYHTTYYNLIKQQINNTDSIDKIISINYGQDLNTEYITKLNEVMSGDPSTYGFDIEVVEDKENYSALINDIDIDSLEIPPSPIIEEDVDNYITDTVVEDVLI